MPTIKINPGRPFWSGTVAFFSSMITLLGLDRLTIEDMSGPALVTVNWVGALLASFFISLVVYGKEKIASFNGKKDHQSA